jgi:circadian clock protein KaiB
MMATPRRKSFPISRKRATWDLRLYVADESPPSKRAFDNLKDACEEHMPGMYHIKVIEILTDPEAARKDQIVALPTLIRRSPKPVRTVIGDLTNNSRLLALLNQN